MSGKIQQFLAVSLVALIGVSAAACARKLPVAPAGTLRDAGIAGVPPSAAPQPSKGKTESRQIELPYSRGETWYVCQGYQGKISHQTRFALDLTVAKDFGVAACHAADGNVNKSARRQVLAPVAGTVMYAGEDFICLQIDQRRSLLIGHIDRSVANGAKVGKDSVLGTVSPAAKVNGGYAHIHIEAFKTPKCALGTSVPMTAANGFQLIGIGDLPDLPGGNDYYKRALTRR